MNHVPSGRLVAALLSLGCATMLAANASAQAVDYPDSTLANPPQLTFPFYTPGSGSANQTVRIQLLCPDSFLAAQNVAPGLVTKVGFTLAGQGVYDVFELRAGTTSVAALGSDWTSNLPDQRVQRNLGNVLLQGGGTVSAPANQWVEFDLDFPFHWQPGQNIVVDVTAHIATPGVHLQSTVGAGVARAYNFNYTPGTSATSFSGSGPSFRLRFEPAELLPFGSGCIGQSGFAPWLSSVGAANTGGSMVVFANQARDGAVGGFLVGLSRTTFAGTQLPLALGGGCALLVSPDVFVPCTIMSTGGGLGVGALAVAVPNDPLLAGFVFHAQYTQFDPATPATVPLTFSNGGTIAVW